MDSRVQTLPDQILAKLIEHRWRLLISLALLALTLMLGKR